MITTSQTVRLRGLPLSLDTIQPAETLSNNHFQSYQLPDAESIYLPVSMRPFLDHPPISSKDFLVDDNRGAITSQPVLTLDHTDFYLFIKGIGTTTNPYSNQQLGKSEVSTLLKEETVKERLVNSSETSPRYITGELWLRGSPYGGQGLEHAKVSLRASEMANPITSIHGFHIAPLVKINLLPEYLEQRIKQVYWYRQYPGRIVQEARLVPSNIRVYFHSNTTIGNNVNQIYNQFNIDTDEKASRFIENFVRSGIAFLTLFPRSITHNSNGTYSGLDFYDVWLDKDAVLAPDGTVYFVDLEGLEWITINKEKVGEKITDQIYRSLYEFMYAYEQLERERERRYGPIIDRKGQLEYYLQQALQDDELVHLAHSGQSLQLVINNILNEPGLVEKFSIIDW